MEISPGRKLCFLEDVPQDTLISAEWGLSPLNEDAETEKYVVVVVILIVVVFVVLLFVIVIDIVIVIVIFEVV